MVHGAPGTAKSAPREIPHSPLEEPATCGTITAYRPPEHEEDDLRTMEGVLEQALADDGVRLPPEGLSLGNNYVVVCSVCGWRSERIALDAETAAKLANAMHHQVPGLCRSSI